MINLVRAETEPKHQQILVDYSTNAFYKSLLQSYSFAFNASQYQHFVVDRMNCKFAFFQQSYVLIRQRLFFKSTDSVF